MLLLTASVSSLFKWRQCEPEVILLAVGWCLRFSLSYRDVQELLAERGLLVDRVTVWTWVQRYAPAMERRLRSRLKPTNDSWRVDEAYIRNKSKWRYLYRAVDSTGATLDFLLSAKQDAGAAKRFLAKALGQQNHPAPRVINTDGHAVYPPAIGKNGKSAAAESPAVYCLSACVERCSHTVPGSLIEIDCRPRIIIVAVAVLISSRVSCKAQRRFIESRALLIIEISTLYMLYVGYTHVK
jgi:transposase-like protein